ncbi:hypothetical protein B0T24DRAFT_591157 [Lasiosphaeria ovina]|uniref:Uncharacterized protein n=1 Tax=Lasiosphaeria ovina TaxID=92902 RepID=A0AAE0NFQ0_9PEZI|nr:hypothetical protein B0T24DRAFT_591157 [Lasiosphaeria ovina]
MSLPSVTFSVMQIPEDQVFETPLWVVQTLDWMILRHVKDEYRQIFIGDIKIRTEQAIREILELDEWAADYPVEFLETREELKEFFEEFNDEFDEAVHDMANVLNAFLETEKIARQIGHERLSYVVLDDIITSLRPGDAVRASQATALQHSPTSATTIDVNEADKARKTAILLRNYFVKATLGITTNQFELARRLLMHAPPTRTPHSEQSLSRIFVSTLPIRKTHQVIASPHWTRRSASSSSSQWTWLRGAYAKDKVLMQRVERVVKRTAGLEPRVGASISDLINVPYLHAVVLPQRFHGLKTVLDDFVQVDQVAGTLGYPALNVEVLSSFGSFLDECDEDDVEYGGEVVPKISLV